MLNENQCFSFSFIRLCLWRLRASAIDREGKDSGSFRGHNRVKPTAANDDDAFAVPSDQNVVAAAIDYGPRPA